MSDDAPSARTITLAMEDYLLLREALIAHVAHIEDLCRTPSDDSALRHQLEKFQAVRTRLVLEPVQMGAAEHAGEPVPARSAKGMQLAALKQEFDGDEG